jgi:hypothetical protein
MQLAIIGGYPRFIITTFLKVQIFTEYIVPDWEAL